MNCSTQSTLSLVSGGRKTYSQLSAYHDEKYQLMWYYMHAAPRSCFTPTLLEDIKCFHGELASEIDAGRNIRYLALASDTQGVFNLGGDLDLFRRLIQTGDRPALMRYATACIDVLYANMAGLGKDITTISLVQGDALGGGFEAAMSSDVLIAERNAKLGLPEVLFNLFPGMGAYSILSRKLDPARAERMILSGKLYTAEELYDLGVVDVLAEDGQGERAVYDYINKENKLWNSYRAMREVKDYCNPVTYEELHGVVEIWVDAAMRLQEKDLRMMERLVMRQSAKARSAA